MYRMTALDHRLLRQFLAVADAGTVRAAALELNMSQPPLTAAIRQLEERLGTTLFARSVKGMQLTPAGQTLAEEARTILGQLARVETRLRAMSGQPPSLTIGFVSAALNGPLQRLLRGLKHDGFPVPRLREMTTPAQVAALREGRLDIGLLHPPVPDLPGLACATLGRDPLWAALPVDHRLASRSTLRFAEIAAEAFVLFPEAQGPVLFDAVRARALAAAGTFRVAAEVPRVHSQLALVAGGLGIALVSRSTAQTLSFDGVVALALTDTANTLYLELALMTDAAGAKDYERWATNAAAAVPDRTPD